MEFCLSKGENRIITLLLKIEKEIQLHLMNISQKEQWCMIKLKSKSNKYICQTNLFLLKTNRLTTFILKNSYVELILIDELDIIGEKQYFDVNINPSMINAPDLINQLNKFLKYQTGKRVYTILTPIVKARLKYTKKNIKLVQKLGYGH